MAFSNDDKPKHEKSAQDSLECILKRCKKNKHLVRDESDYSFDWFQKEYRIGKEGFKDSSQFYAPFLISFKDGTKWALFTTISMRADRIKEQQWNAINLKEIDPWIKKVYLVYPDGASEKKKFINEGKKYRDKEKYSAIDDIVSQNKINDLIEKYATCNARSGQQKNLQGKFFEVRVVDTLSFAQNLSKWKSGDDKIAGMHYDMFKNIVECFGISASDTQEISATSDIKPLDSGGTPKTDVLVTVCYTNGTQEHFTISCKRSSNKKVSVHQYDADTFADVLDKDNAQLRELLQYFQKCGSPKALGCEKEKKLTKALAPYVEKLSLWVLGGKGGGGNPEQIAEFILTYNNNDNSSTINTVENYYKHLIDGGVDGQLGTPFKWTHNHKEHDIRLQCKIIK